jgi:hypothetical protein
MAGLPPTFAEHVRARQANKGLADGRAAINDHIHDFAASRRSTPASREFQEMRAEKDAVVASMDQGSRGAEHAPPIANANDYLRAAFRESLESRAER